MATGIGETLRETRERQGRSIEEGTRATRVRGDLLRALEDEDFAAFGGDVYAKGFLRTYASWLGLDPEPLLETYRREVQREDVTAHALVDHPVARQPRSGPPPWVVWGLVTAIVLVIALAIVGLTGGRVPEIAEEPRGIETAATPTPTGSAPAVDDPSPDADGPSPTPTAVELALLLEGDSWVRVVADGQVVLEETLDAGESREVEARGEVELRLGNAGGVRLILNGRPIDPVGGRGEVVDVVCSPSDCTRA